MWLQVTYTAYSVWRIAWDGLGSEKKVLAYYYKHLSGLKPSDVALQILQRPSDFNDADNSLTGNCR